jgi:hypothetical protein
MTQKPLQNLFDVSEEEDEGDVKTGRQAKIEDNEPEKAEFSSGIRKQSTRRRI